MSAEIRAGYKLTAVGVIPGNWDVRRLHEVVDFLDGQRRPVKDTDRGKMQGDIPYYGASGIVDYVNDYLFNDDLILLGEDGENILSRNCRLAFRVSGKIWVNNHAHVLKPKNGNEIGYFVEFLESLNYEQYNTGTAQPKLNKQVCSGLHVVVPPLPEQRAIATTLSDVDALLAKLDALIAKKRDLKVAAMQQLLTGQTRLPGFGGAWEVRPLASVVANLEAGVSVNSVDHGKPLSSGAPCILKTSAIFNGRFDPEECKLIDRSDYSRAKVSPRRNTIIISRMNTPNLVGEVGFVPADFPTLNLPDRLWMTRFDPGADICARWLAYLMSSVQVKENIKGLATGTSGSMKNIGKNALLALQLEFPTGEEQTAIATILSAMDAELTALEARRDKTRALKQGMMQELLTGKIRLVSTTPQP